MLKQKRCSVVLSFSRVSKLIKKLEEQGES